MIYEQYQAIKRAQPNAVLLMQVGDFYQAFGKDAQILVSVMGATCRRVTLGKRNEETYGVPAATLDATIQALLGHGHKVAVAQQVSQQQSAGHPIERVMTDARMAAPHVERTPLP